MEDKIDKAIEKMADMASASRQPNEAMNFAQAALNLAHAKSVLHGVRKETKTKGGGSRPTTEA